MAAIYPKLAHGRLKLVNELKALGQTQTWSKKPKEPVCKKNLSQINH